MSTGQLHMWPFLPKLLAAMATVGLGGSPPLEGPSIYGGASDRFVALDEASQLRPIQRNRRIMLISGAAAGMSAVFRAPLTGIIFALDCLIRTIWRTRLCCLR